MRARKLRCGLVLTLLVGTLFGISGCNFEDLDYQQILMDVLQMYGKEIAAYKIWGTSGDPGVDAVMQARDTINQIGEADALMEEAWEQGDPLVMEQAIEIRPRDWTYRVDAASLYLAQNEIGAAEEHLRAADKVVPDDPAAKDRHAFQVIQNFEDIKASGDTEGYTSLEQCNKVHDELIHYYDQRWTISGQSGPSPGGQQVAEEKQRCTERLQP